MRKLGLLLAFFLLVACLMLPAFAADQSVTVLDRAELLAPAEAQTIAASLENPVKGIKYILVTGTEAKRPDDETAFRVCNITSSDKAVVLWVRYTGGKYYYDVYPFGKADRYFSNSKIDEILDDTNVYNNIKAGRVAEGCAAFFRLADQHIAGRPLRSVKIGLIVGVLAGGGAMLGVWSAYHKKKHGESYPLDRYARLNLTAREDRFVGSHVTRVRIESSSSSGGRSSSGGGFSGGHRGGR